MKARYLLALLLVVMCAWAGPARAQSQAANGAIEGTVKDIQGGVLPGVTVTVQHRHGHAARRRTNTGLYRAPLLPLGKVQRRRGAAGFKKFEQTDIELSVGQTAVVLNETLAVGTVSARRSRSRREAGRSISARIDIGHTMSELEVHNLPLVARNPYNFALRRSRASPASRTSSSACRASPPTAPRCASTTRSTATPTPRRIAPACGCCRCRK